MIANVTFIVYGLAIVAAAIFVVVLLVWGF